MRLGVRVLPGFILPLASLLGALIYVATLRIVSPRYCRRRIAGLDSSDRIYFPKSEAGRPICQSRTWIAGNMAKTVNVIVTDDIDGSSGAEAVSFSFDGQGYELDLGPANRQRMQESLQPFMDAGRQLGRRTQRRVGPRRSDLAAIRAWAAGQDLRISARGRISTEIMNAYDASH